MYEDMETQKRKFECSNECEPVKYNLRKKMVQFIRKIQTMVLMYFVIMALGLKITILWIIQTSY